MGRLYAALALIESPLATRRGDLPKFEGEELVVVTSPMFPTRSARDTTTRSTKIVKEVNGVPIKNLRHFVEVLRDSKEKFTTIRFDDKVLRNDRLQPSRGPQGHRRDPLGQRHPRAGVRGSDGGLVQEEVTRS